MGPPCDGIVNTNLPAIYLHAIEYVSSLISILLALKVDEGESLAVPELAVPHQVHLQGPEPLEHFVELRLISGRTQIEHAETFVGLRILSGALVTSSAGHWGP